jgi:hypothetical protein
MSIGHHPSHSLCFIRTGRHHPFLCASGPTPFPRRDVWQDRDRDKRRDREKDRGGDKEKEKEKGKEKEREKERERPREKEADKTRMLVSYDEDEEEDEEGGQWPIVAEVMLDTSAQPCWKDGWGSAHNVPPMSLSPVVLIHLVRCSRL